MRTPDPFCTKCGTTLVWEDAFLQENLHCPNKCKASQPLYNFTIAAEKLREMEATQGGDPLWKMRLRLEEAKRQRLKGYYLGKLG